MLRAKSFKYLCKVLFRDSSHLQTIMPFLVQTLVIIIIFKISFSYISTFTILLHIIWHDFVALCNGIYSVIFQVLH